MLKSSLSDYNDTYILVKGRTTITGAGADAGRRQADERDNGVMFKNCSLFINRKSEINNTQICNAKDFDIVMPMDNLSIVISIQKHLKIYGNTTKMSQMIT